MKDDHVLQVLRVYIAFEMIKQIEINAGLSSSWLKLKDAQKVKGNTDLPCKQSIRTNNPVSNVLGQYELPTEPQVFFFQYYHPRNVYLP